MLITARAPKSRCSVALSALGLFAAAFHCLVDVSRDVAQFIQVASALQQRLSCLRTWVTPRSSVVSA